MMQTENESKGRLKGTLVFGGKQWLAVKWLHKHLSNAWKEKSWVIPNYLKHTSSVTAKCLPNPLSVGSELND